MATFSSMKRPRGSPTGTTPIQAEKKRVQKRPEVQHGARRVLARSYPPRSGPGTQSIVPGSAWSNQETLALVDYILSRKLVKSDWPKTTDMDFWSRASKFVQNRANSTLIRTDHACRSKVCRQLSQLYPNPLCAKKELQSELNIPCPASKDDTQPVLSESAANLTATRDDCVPHSAPLGSIKVQSLTTCTTATSSWASFNNQEVVTTTPASDPDELQRQNPACATISSDADLSNLTSEQFRQVKKRPQTASDPFVLGSSLPSNSCCTVKKTDNLMSQVHSLPHEEKLALIRDLYHDICIHQQMYVPKDFIDLSLQAMENLNASGRSNVLYELAFGLGTLRPDGSGPRFPTDRMPMGLLEYIVNFFASESMNETRQCPKDYLLWLESMYSLFGNKWMKLHRGPGWEGDVIAQDSTCTRKKQCGFDPLEARVNVPAPSARTIRQHVSESPYTKTSEIQIAVLDEARKIHPNAQWWLKADGCDLIKALGDSVNHDWTGDVDLNDGQLAKLHSNFLNRLDFLSNICRDLTDSNEREKTLSDLRVEQAQLCKDLTFLYEMLQSVNKEYSEKVAEGKSTQKVLYGLAWQLKELETLCEEGRKLKVEIGVIIDHLSNPSADILRLNVALKICNLQTALTTFVENLSKQQRTAATHIWVVMISPEERRSKPYALPVQCIPYKNLTASVARDIINNIIKVMTSKGMAVAGLVTDGEFNCFRARGNTRPVSIFAIRSDARAKYSRLGKTTMLSMLTPKYNKDGSITAIKPNPAVPVAALKEIMEWKKNGATEDDIIGRLRIRTVPNGYPTHRWSDSPDLDKEETIVEKLRSILSQMEYTYQVCCWDAKGVPFRTHMYVPDIHPITGTEFHEREDEAHVLKRIGHSTRAGGPDELQLQRFHEALGDPETKLSYPALTGQRKQSVRDVENLLSSRMVKFMESNDYQFEAKYIRVIMNWRRACDERGLSPLMRSRFNYELLNYLLDDLMPWHNELYDFSLLEVNRDITNIRGLTRESLIALTTNIESREQKRSNVSRGLMQEHPRASSTDDVECFFSVIRDAVSKHFTYKNIQFAWRKGCIEFGKRLNPELPFYYHTSSHDRFYEGLRPEFSLKDQLSKHNPRNQRVRRYEQPSSIVMGRASLPTPGARSIRFSFHNVPIEQPPPPIRPYNPVLEHSYSK